MAEQPLLDPSVIWYVDAGDNRPLFLPYPGGYSPGSYEAASAITLVNRGWRAVPMTVIPMEEPDE